MKINQNNIIEDAQKMLNGMQFSSYSKLKIINPDLNAINYLFSKVGNKYFEFPKMYNPYHERLFARADAKQMDDYCEFVFLYMNEYLKLVESYLSILDNNNLTRTDYIDGKVYSANQIKDIMLDFFNEQGVDKYKIVKSMFDEERIEILKKDLGDAKAICSIMLSGIKPYIIVDAEPNRVRLYDMCNLAHELGHAIEANKKLNRYTQSMGGRKKLLVEVPSNFYEYEFDKYLQRNQIELRNANSMINIYHSKSKNFCGALSFALSDEMIQDGEKYTQVEDGMGIDDEGNLVRAFRKEGSDEIHIFDFDLYSPLKYAIGSLAALNLHVLKEKNPQEFDKLWNYFLSMRTLLDEKSILNLFGIKLEEFIECKNIESLIKEDVKIYNKQLKRQL